MNVISGYIHLLFYDLIKRENAHISFIFPFRLEWHCLLFLQGGNVCSNATCKCNWFQLPARPELGHMAKWINIGVWEIWIWFVIVYCERSMWCRHRHNFCCWSPLFSSYTNILSGFLEEIAINSQVYSLFNQSHRSKNSSWDISYLHLQLGSEDTDSNSSSSWSYIFITWSSISLPRTTVQRCIRDVLISSQSCIF